MIKKNDDEIYTVTGEDFFYFFYMEICNIINRCKKLKYFSGY